jgi:hypothetical protein
MNPDKEDPNNHAPAVTPDDDWDGLDVEQDFNAQLPPRRADTPRIPKLDLNLSEIKSIEPARHATGATSSREDSNIKPSVSIHINVNPEREFSEKEDFLPALVMEDVKQGDFSARNIKRPITLSRSKLGERDDWGTVEKKGSSRWMLYTAVGMIMLIVLTVSFSYFNRDKPIRNADDKGSNKPAPVDRNKESDIDPSVLAQLANGDKEAIQIYGNYAQAKSPDDFTESIYLSKRNAQAVARAWKPISAENGWLPSDTSAWKTYQNGSLVFAELRGTNHNFSKFIGVFRYEKKELKMDWKATAGYGSASFTELKSGLGDASEIRGWIEPSNFFTRQLPEERYHSFILRSPDDADSVWGYTEIGSDADTKLMQLFSVSPITEEQKTEAKVILKLDRGDPGNLPQQWMIKSLIAENWLDQATP